MRNVSDNAKKCTDCGLMIGASDDLAGLLSEECPACGGEFEDVESNI